MVASRQFLGVMYSNQNVVSLDCFHKEPRLALSPLGVMTASFHSQMTPRSPLLLRVRQQCDACDFHTI